MAHYEQVRKEVNALDAMVKGNYSIYIKFTKKTELNQAVKELTTARTKAAKLHRQADLDLFESEHKAREEQ